MTRIGILVPDEPPFAFLFWPQTGCVFVLPVSSIVGQRIFKSVVLHSF